MTATHALMNWFLEKAFSVEPLSYIKHPKKDHLGFKPGETVRSRCYGHAGVFDAKIVATGTDI